DPGRDGDRARGGVRRPRPGDGSRLGRGRGGCVRRGAPAVAPGDAQPPAAPALGAMPIPTDLGEAPADPFALFDAWYAEAERAGLALPEAVALATATPDGVPSARMVLYRGQSGGGLRF